MPSEFNAERDVYLSLNVGLIEARVVVFVKMSQTIRATSQMLLHRPVE
jgi:hypothetical protein